MSNLTYKGFNINWQYNIETNKLTVKCVKLQERADNRDLVKRHYNDTKLESTVNVLGALYLPQSIMFEAERMVDEHLKQIANN